MELWIARDADSLLYLYREKPFLIKGNSYFDGKYLIGEIDATSFPEVIFENSPQKVKIELIKE